jgi:CDGSH-type Zn-finger protein
VTAPNPAMLCTCGQSGTKPFRDYSHAENGWREDETLAREQPAPAAPAAPRASRSRISSHLSRSCGHRS